MNKLIRYLKGLLCALASGLCAYVVAQVLLASVLFIADHDADISLGHTWFWPTITGAIAMVIVAAINIRLIRRNLDGVHGLAYVTPAKLFDSAMSAIGLLPGEKSDT